MDEKQVFTIIKHIIIDVIPTLKNYPIAINDSLKELGANSVDRAEILICTMAFLKIKLPLVEFAQAKNIKEVISILINHQRIMK